MGRRHGSATFLTTSHRVTPGESPMRLFVYGTLLRGMERQGALRSSTYRGLGLVRASLCDLGPFPGLVAGRDQDVVGEIWDVDEKTVETIDAIEGHDNQDPTNSLFLRAPATITRLATGTPARVEAYWFNRILPTEARIIHHGCYRRHRLETSSWPQPVIAYGFNSATHNLEARVRSSARTTAGWLPGFERVLNKDTGDGIHAYANLRHRSEAKQPVMLHWLTAQQVALLDEFEAVASGHYRRIALPALPHDSSDTLLAHAWIANPDWVCEQRCASDNYAKALEDGDAEWADIAHIASNTSREAGKV